MTSCTSCGHESASTARFCAECGLPLVSPDAVGAEVTVGSDKSDWLTATDPAESGTVRSPGVRRGVKHPVAMVAAGLILAIVAWNLFRPPTTEVEDLAGDLGVLTPTTFVSTTVAGRATSSTTTATGADTVDVGELDPALTRYHLFAHSPGQLLRIDLVDGSTSLHDAPGRLLGAFGRRLILLDRDGTVTALSLDDLDADPESLGEPAESGHDVVAASLTSDGVVHLTTGFFSSARPDLRMTRLDLASGSTQSVAVERYGSFGLIEVPGGGLFELAENGFRPLVDGSVRFHGERLIVVEECTTPDQCRRYWLDRSTGEEVDRPVPEQADGVLLGPGGRVAMVFGTSSPVLVDLETGDAFPNTVGLSDDPGIAISRNALTPDERFLAARNSAASRAIMIHDLERRVSWTIELEALPRISRVLFVPKAADG